MRNIYRMNKLFFLELLNGVIDILLMVCQIKLKKNQKGSGKHCNMWVNPLWIQAVFFVIIFLFSPFFSRDLVLLLAFFSAPTAWSKLQLSFVCCSFVLRHASHWHWGVLSGCGWCDWLFFRGNWVGIS